MFANLNNIWKYSIVVYIIICLLLLSWTILQFIAIIIAYAVIQNISVIIYLLNVLIFICRGNSLSPPPPPPPLALLTAQQELLKIYVSICIIYAIFTCFSNKESV